MYIRPLITLLALLIFSACQTDPCGKSKEQFIDNYNNLLEKVETQGMSYSDKRWTNYDRKFEKHITECYENHKFALSAEEQEVFWTGAVQYYYRRYGTGMFKQLQKDGDPITQAIVNNVGEVWKNPKQGFRLIFDDLNISSKESEELGEMVQEFLSNWGSVIRAIDKMRKKK